MKRYTVSLSGPSRDGGRYFVTLAFGDDLIATWQSKSLRKLLYHAARMIEADTPHRKHS